MDKVESLKLKMQQNERKAQMLSEKYGVGLRPESAMSHRLVYLIKSVVPEVDPQTMSLSQMVEMLASHLLGPMGEDATDERLDFELEWQGEIASSLEQAHAEALEAQREANQPKLILPNANGSGKGLHLP